MRKIALIMCCILTAAAGAARPGTFPAEITYLIYVYGEPAGKDVIKITETGDAVLFESHSKLQFDEFTLDLRARTEVSRDGWTPRSFSYEGIRGGIQASGTVQIAGDSASGEHTLAKAQFPTSIKLEGRTLLFENYLIEHQVVILNMLAESDELYQRFALLFPIDFMSTQALATIESDVEIDTTPQAVCRKYYFSVQGGSSFYGYFDAKRKLPVYMDFPSTSTEVFLQEAFSDPPAAKYVRPESSP